jgi:hypothetical protein
MNATEAIVDRIFRCFALIVVAVGLIVMGAALQGERSAYDCKHYGGFPIDDLQYECHVVGPRTRPYAEQRDPKP